MAGVVTRWRRAAVNIAAGAVDLLLPSVCSGCDAARIEADGLCTKCNRDLLELVALTYCPRCGASLGPGIPPGLEGCDACPPTLGRFERVVRIGSYRPPLKGILRGWKYSLRDRMAPRLADLLSQAIRAAGIEPDVVVHVPMHWQRRLVRGHDHAEKFARLLASRLGREYLPALRRTRRVRPQVHLPRTRRIENVRNSMIPAREGMLDRLSVLLVDDVTTTGATADEAARICLSAGAQQVVLAVAAKSEPPRAYARGKQLS